MPEASPKSEYNHLDTVEKLAGRIIIGATAALPTVILANQLPDYNHSASAVGFAVSAALYVAVRYRSDAR